MDMTQKKFSVYIGRFQPPHVGHISTIKYCLEISDIAIVVLGSANSSRDVKNPFSDAERAGMIRGCFSDEENNRLVITFVEDRYYQNAHWITDVHHAVASEVSKFGWVDKSHNITIVGYKKDHSSWYLDCFPQWKEVLIEAHKGDVEYAEPINSTEIRDLLFEGRVSYIKSVVDPSVYKFILEFMQTETYFLLRKEYHAHLEYEKIFHNIPASWSVNFYTCDAVVVQSGHILLVKRAEMPGKGLWALPGGHVGSNETSEDAAIRELVEETSLKVPEKVLRGSIRNQRIFENPDRSLRCRVSSRRGRTITHAYNFVLDDSQKLPKVKGASDAAEENGGKAWWFPIGELKMMRDQMFEDHYDIAWYFIDQLN